MNNIILMKLSNGEQYMYLVHNLSPDLDDELDLSRLNPSDLYSVKEVFDPANRTMGLVIMRMDNTKILFYSKEYISINPDEVVMTMNVEVTPTLENLIKEADNQASNIIIPNQNIL